jgi:hypothetical protein
MLAGPGSTEVLVFGTVKGLSTPWTVLVDEDVRGWYVTTSTWE